MPAGIRETGTVVLSSNCNLKCMLGQKKNSLCDYRVGPREAVETGIEVVENFLDGPFRSKKKFSLKTDFTSPMGKRLKQSIFSSM